MQLILSVNEICYFDMKIVECVDFVEFALNWFTPAVHCKNE